MSSWLPVPFKIIILGGGISGLSAAHTILKYAKVPTEVTLLETQRRIGGWLESTRFEDGTVFEHGPRSARSYGNIAIEALNMLSDLDIEDKFIGIPKTADEAKRRYIYAKGEIHELPTGYKLLTRNEPLSRSLISYMLREVFVKKKSDMEDESVFDFFERRFNSKEIADYLCDPLCRGIFGGDSKKLSIRSCFPMLFNYEQDHGSIVKGALFTKSSKSGTDDRNLVKKAKNEKWMAWTLKNGIQSLPDTWTKYLTGLGLTVLLNTHCTELKIKPTDGRIQCITNGGTIEADQVISTLPAYSLSRIIYNEDKKLSDMLSSIEYADMAVVNLEYKNATIQYKGFGYLVPSCEPLDILGVTFDSQIFPQHSKDNSTILTVMAGGARFHELFGDPSSADTSKITELAVRSVRDTLKIKDDPIRHICKINKGCIPQYYVGHHKIAQNITDHVKAHDMPLTILGNAWGGVGVNDVIVNSRNETLKWLASHHMY